MKKKNNKRFITSSIITIVAIIIIVIGVWSIFFKHDQDNKQPEEITGPKEEDIETNYEMTKEEAISIIKTIFHSDNYSFSAELNNDSQYVVTVTNTLTDKKYIYYVDPATKTYKIDDNTK